MEDELNELIQNFHSMSTLDEDEEDNDYARGRASAWAEAAAMLEETVAGFSVQPAT